jgi:hypothetical protein
MTNGDTINLDELKMGLGLGMGLESVNREEISMIEEEVESGEEDMDTPGDDSSVFDEEVEAAEEPTVSASPQKEATTTSDMFKLKLQPKPPALRETNGNKSPSRSPRKVAFSASIPNTPTQVEVDENIDASGLDLVDPDKDSGPVSASKGRRQEDRTPRHVRCDAIADQIIGMASKVTFSSSPCLLPNSPTAPHSNRNLQTRKRHSSPRPHPDEPSPKLTVHDKLAQAEADAAAVAEGLKVVPSKGLEDTELPEDSRTRRAVRSPTKTKIHGRPKRRKSTLTPEELGNLLGC